MSRAMTSRRRRARIAASRRGASARVAGLVVMFLLGACRADVDVAIDLEPDGSGTVDVSVSVDREVLDHAPDLDDLLRTDDLQAAGWTIGGGRNGEGLTWTAVKSFSSIDQLDAVLSEIDGVGDLAGNSTFRVELRDALTTHRFGLDVQIPTDVASFSLPDTASHLDGEAFGASRAELEARAGSPLEETVRFRVSASLLGENASSGGGMFVTMANGGSERLEIVVNTTDESVLDAQRRAADARDRLPDAIRAIVIWWVVLAGVVVALTMFWRRERRRREPPTPTI